jgi:hypothetical protein
VSAFACAGFCMFGLQLCAFVSDMKRRADTTMAGIFIYSASIFNAALRKVSGLVAHHYV